jgi:hypothetical protein
MVAVLVAATIATMFASEALASTDVIDFEDLPAGTLVTSQYHSQGIDFGVSPTSPSDAGERLFVTEVPPEKAHSGTHVAAIAACTVEVCSGFRPIWAKLMTAHRHVALYVGAGLNSTARVELTAFDAAGNQLASDTTQAGPAALTPLAVDTPSDSIAFIQVAQVGGSEARAAISLDDLTFNTPQAPPTPDFGIARDLAGNYSPNGEVDLVKGESTAVKLVINRYNGATGNLKFTVAGLPPGVSSSLTPSTVTAASTVTLTLSASSAAATENGTVVVTADPQSNAQAGASSHSLSFTVQVLGNYDLSLVGIEVTQGTQRQLQPCTDPAACSSLISLPWLPLNGGSQTTDYSGVLLVRHGVTIVRVFGRVKSPAGQTVTGVTVALHGFRDGKELPGSPLISSQKQLANGRSWATFLDRADPQNGWGFSLPPNWTEGTISLKAEVIDPNQISLGPAVAECETPSCKADNFFTLRNVPFVNDTGHITVGLVRLSTKPDDYFDHVTPFPSAVLGTAERLAPLAPGELRYAPDYEGWIDISDLVTPIRVRSQILAQDSAIADRLEDWIDDHPPCEKSACADQTVGVFTKVGNGLSRGKLLDGDAPVSVVESTRPLTSVAHELAHGWGRVHASDGCGGGDNGQIAEPWPPDEQGFTQGIGLDVRAGTGGDPGSPYRVIAPGSLGAPAGSVNGPKEPSNWFDFMSYCAGGNESAAWISPKGWDEEVELLNAIEIFDEHPHSDIANATDVGSGALLRVHAYVKPDGTVTITSVKPLSGLPIAGRTNSGYHLISHDRFGGTLANTGMRQIAGHVDGFGNVEYLTGDVPGRGAASVAIMRDGIVVGARARSRHTPSVRVLAPRQGARVGRGKTTLIRWHAADRDRDKLVARVDYSIDDGRHYMPLYEGPNRGSASMPSAMLSGSSQARVRVTVNDGFNQTAAISGRFRAAGRPPQARIITPVRGAAFSAANTIVVAGTAYDDRRLEIPASRLRWFDGRHQLGRGNQLSINGLLPGLRRIRLVARDRAGRIGVAVVSIHIQPVRPRFILLRVPTRMRSGARSLTLRVSTTVPAILATRHARYRVSRHVRALRVRVPRGNGTLRLVLTLRAGRLRSFAILTIARGPR